MIAIRSALFGRSLTSLPFVNFGGVLAVSHAAADALLEEADVHPRALYTKGAAAELWRFRQSFISDLRRAGALVLDARPKELTSSLINTYLEVKARHLL